MVTPKLPPQMRPPEWDIADAYAFQALQRGEATPEAQRRALEWLVNQGAATYQLSFHPESTQLTAFAEGRRFVGQQVLKLLLVDTHKMKKATDNG